MDERSITESFPAVKSREAAFQLPEDSLALLGGDVEALDVVTLNGVRFYRVQANADAATAELLESVTRDLEAVGFALQRAQGLLSEIKAPPSDAADFELGEKPVPVHDPDKVGSIIDQLSEAERVDVINGNCDRDSRICICQSPHAEKLTALGLYAEPNSAGSRAQTQLGARVAYALEQMLLPRGRMSDPV